MTMIAAKPLPIGVFGPASSTDNAVARFDGITGKIIQNSGVTINDAGTVNLPAGQSLTINGQPIPWADISKSGSSLADLATKSAGALDSGNLAVARMPTGGEWALSSALGLTGANVGIGTTSPSYSLNIHVASTVNYYPLALTTGVIGQLGGSIGVRFGYTGNSYQKGAIIFEGQDGHARGKFHFALDPNLNSHNAEITDSKMTIQYDGKVGIGTTSPTALLDVNSDILRLRTAKTPASAGASGNTGDICWDASYVYICVATNTWKRVAIGTW